MRKTLYLKFILAYIIFGVFGFIMVATFVSNMTYEQLKREKSEQLYNEATLIANTYAADLYNSTTSLDTVKKQLDALDVYMDAVIWIINPSGRMIIDSSKPLNLDEEVVVEGFDPTITASGYYTTGNFFGSFSEDMLSVFAPISADFKVKGYVVIHARLTDIRTSREGLLNISYILLVLLFLLSMIILIFFTEFVYLPLRKITDATEQYASGNMHYEFSIQHSALCIVHCALCIVH